jgi:hypothetical protein
MNRKLIFAVCLLVCAVSIATPLWTADNGPATRILQGQILKSSEAPLPGAVVYLKNTKTLAVRSFISDGKGNYRFTALSPNIDYEVHAEYQGQKSDTKTLSSFDSRSTATINLRINVR